jgi:serine/threonine protein kinase
MDLLKAMLEKDPSKRIKASDALNHEFIRPMGNM